MKSKQLRRKIITVSGCTTLFASALADGQRSLEAQLVLSREHSQFPEFD